MAPRDAACRAIFDRPLEARNVSRAIDRLQKKNVRSMQRSLTKKKVSFDRKLVSKVTLAQAEPMARAPEVLVASRWLPVPDQNSTGTLLKLET